MLKGVIAVIIAAAGRFSMGSPVHRLDDFLPLDICDAHMVGWLLSPSA
jgi:hypothetical protein